MGWGAVRESESGGMGEAASEMTIGRREGGMRETKRGEGVSEVSEAVSGQFPLKQPTGIDLVAERHFTARDPNEAGCGAFQPPFAFTGSP